MEIFNNFELFNMLIHKLLDSEVKSIHFTVILFEESQEDLN